MFMNKEDFLAEDIWNIEHIQSYVDIRDKVTEEKNHRDAGTTSDLYIHERETNLDLACVVSLNVKANPCPKLHSLIPLPFP